MKFTYSRLHLAAFALFTVTQFCECQQQKYTKTPLVFPNFPPVVRTRHNLPMRGSHMYLKSPSNNVPVRVHHPGLVLKHNHPNQFLSTRYVNRPIKSSLLSHPSMQLFFKANKPQPQTLAALKRAPNMPVLKIFTTSTSAPHTTSIKFNHPPPNNKKPKPNEYIFEKVNVPKFPEPAIHSSAIHTIPAPNLSLLNGQPIPDLTIQNVNNHIDKNIPNYSPVVRPEKLSHQYQVTEDTKDFFAPDPDKAFYRPLIKPVDDPLSNPSITSPLPDDIKTASALALHGYNFPLSTPQLQQHISQQASMLEQGLPLHVYNPTYLVAQSNRLFSQHQQHLNGGLLKPEISYLDNQVQPNPQLVFNSVDYVKPNEYHGNAASLGQIYAATQDQLNELQNLQLQTAQLQQAVSSTPATTLSTAGFSPSFIEAASEETPTFAHLFAPNYNINQVADNLVEQPLQYTSNNDLSNNYNSYQEFLHQRQSENDKILQLAQQEAHNKKLIMEQQEKSALQLHQQALAEQFKNANQKLHIVVPDYNDNAHAQSRVDDYDESYSDENYDEPENFKKSDSKE